MKRYIIFLLGLFLSTTVFAQEGIQFFHGSWSELKAEAKKQKKLIMVDAYTTWCGPCKWMASEVFPEAEVGAFYNENFVPYKLDMEKGEGPAIAKQYNVRFYPTFLFLDATGKLVHRSIGMREAPAFIEEGKNALNPETQLYARIERFNKGEKDTIFLSKLAADAVSESDEFQQEVLNRYWANIKEKNYIQPNNWEMFTRYDKDINSPAYKYITANKAAFHDMYGQEVVENTLLEKAAMTMEIAAQTKNPELFHQAQDIMAKSPDGKINEYGAYAEIFFYRAMGDWDKYIAAGDRYAEQFAKGDADKLNKLAWDVYTSGTDNQKLISKGVQWAKASMDASKEYYNTDTYAALLYANERLEEAEKYALEAIEMAKAANEDYTSTQELLDKIRSAKAK